jgi:hypothetical protein
LKRIWQIERMAYFKTTQSNGTSAPGYGAIPTTGTSGQYLISGAGNSTNAIWTTGTSSIPNEALRINQTNPPTIDVKGNMVINGRDLEERLKTIETVLQIPERDVILERKHPKLKKLYDEYIQALGEYRTFEAIKGEDDVA